MKEKLKKNSEKLNCASNKAITLTSLVIYITVMFVVLATITRIIAYFRNNMVEVADVTFETEFEKFNLYFLDETKKTENSITEIPEDKKEIIFATSNKYSYDNETKEIYLNDSVKICEQVENCTFAQSQLDNGKTQITVTLKIGNTEKEVNYVMNNIKQSNSINEFAYVWDEYRRNLPVYSKTLLNEEGVLTVNAKYTDGEDVAVIPKGFKISDEEKEQTISEGLVIQDEAGNEFVWIPVKVTKNDTKENIAEFYRSDWEEDDDNGGKRGASLKDSTIYTEPFVDGYEEEETDYKNMLESVYKNKGFYIGRYEAGTASPRTKSTEGTTTNWVVQRDKFPYIYVGWGQSMKIYTGNVYDTDNINRGLGALALCKGFYPTDPEDPNYKGDVGVTCTLCYGVQWDAMLNFIKDKSHDVTNSTTWGNYLDNAWRITREEPSGTSSPSVLTSWKSAYEMGEKTSDTNILLTTGASDSFVAKNIYDVAGNVLEWTNEAYSSNRRVRRGGRYNIGGSEQPAYYRSDISTNYCHNGLGFRPALYIK